jgi:hypothetical protein
MSDKTKERPCASKCGATLIPVAYQIRHGIYLCKACRAAKHKAQEDRLKAQGIVRQRWDLRREKMAEYRSRPEVKRREVERYRKRMESPEEQVKAKARLQLRRAIAEGRIRRGPCEHCGLAKTHGHHTDYSKPLDVVWLCSPCHKKEHKRLAALEKTR